MTKLKVTFKEVSIVEVEVDIPDTTTTGELYDVIREYANEQDKEEVSFTSEIIDTKKVDS